MPDVLDAPRQLNRRGQERSTVLIEHFFSFKRPVLASNACGQAVPQLLELGVCFGFVFSIDSTATCRRNRGERGRCKGDGPRDQSDSQACFHERTQSR